MRPGHVVAGRYEIVALIGRGANGAVYRARQLPLGREVALKMVLPEVALSAGSVERFQREASLVQQLEHPNTVRLFDVGTTEHGMPFMALELLRGRTLEEEVQKAPMNANRVGHVAAQVLKSLMEAHAKGIIHRDIKPSNVFLADYSGEPDFTKVLDFGVARPVTVAGGSITKDGQIVGTPIYMAPEQVQGLEVGPPADLYALGLVMIEAMSGRPVYNGPSAIDVWIQKSSPDPTPIPKLVAQSVLGPVIEKATRKTPSERYQTAVEMLTALEHALATSQPSIDSMPRRSDGPAKTVPLALPLLQKARQALQAPPSMLVPQPSSGKGHTARPPPVSSDPPSPRLPPPPRAPTPTPIPSGPPPNTTTLPPHPSIVATGPSPEPPSKGLATVTAVLAAIVIVLLGVIGVGGYFLFFKTKSTVVVQVPPSGEGKLGTMTPDELEKRIGEAGWSVKRRDVQDAGFGFKIATYDARRETLAATVQLYDYESATIATQTAEGLAKQADGVHLREGGKILFVAVWQDQATAKQLLDQLAP